MNLKPRYPLQFLVALIAASLLWHALAAKRSENISVRGVQARLTLVNMNRDLILMSSVPDTVSLQLRGPLTRALSSTAPPEVLLDLSDAPPGLTSFPINPSDIDELPEDVVVVSIDPSAITLELERQESRIVPVRPSVSGAPAPGFVVGEVRVMPAQFTIQGPESLLMALEYVETGLISIEDAAGPVEAMVEPLLPDPLLRAIGLGPIQVVVEIGPENPQEAEEAPGD